MIATLALSALLLLPTPPPSAADALPRDGERVLFIGDSITQAGHYVVYVEAYLLTRFPDRTITVINHGLSSETAAGTSEPDHPFPRPWIHDRFERDVTAWHPDRVVACYGMNDGIYHPFSPDRFARYQAGINRLIERARLEAGARIDLMTPPPYDPYRRQVGDPNAKHYGYRFPAVDYDDVLSRFGDWLRSLADDRLLVADPHGEISEHLRLRREDRVSVSLSPDGVHPDPAGHWLIAQALLTAWGAPAEVAEARVIVDPDSGTVRAEEGTLDDLSLRDGSLEMTWTSPLPLPLDPSWDPEFIRVAQIADRLNRYRLTVSGLPPGTYTLLASETVDPTPKPVATCSAEELSAGLDLTSLPDFPTVAASRDVLRLLASLRSAQAQAWRASIRGEAPADSPPPPGDDDHLMAPIRALCQPLEVRIRISPVGDSSPSAPASPKDRASPRPHSLP
ncbi:SGNH/GDSL hydrolase family protein [Tautonia sociabilis]|uniref:SGNH hydrolase-type esterase domain-containing protein n=1 Tax=Tautonia sociabilis TaxID=2080755 RepID=A0A432MFB9_9BACT|nr:SGNH/GDSL hydrolase family protein [Tautonia sociabilis]RUL84884.1 hypothetical protein TsocGM_19605 [Tautonia sociabilis]